MEQHVDVVDDDAAHRKLMRILVAEAGFSPRTHATADAAFEIARLDPPSLVIADVQLPGAMDGVALTRALKSAPETAHVPVLVVSAFAAAADEARARRAGCDAWLAKPLDTREFVSLVRWLMTMWMSDVEAL
ncbi:MAG TPA: response regulator [Gemmatimonadaceae bacterium]|nr:response regulator [Gemmatimonadaceae bacterium]